MFGFLGTLIPWIARGASALFNVVKTALSPTNLIKTVDKVSKVASVASGVAGLANQALEGAKQLPEVGDKVKTFTDKNKFIQDGLNAAGKVGKDIKGAVENIRPQLLAM